MPDPLPTGSVAAVADAATTGLQLAAQLYGYANTPDEHNQAVANIDAKLLAAFRAAIAAGDTNTADALLRPTT